MNLRVKIKDTIQIPIELVNEFLTNPLNSLRDYASIPTDAISPFFPDIRRLDKCLTPYNPFDSTLRCFDEDFACKDEFFRYIHIDLGWKKDGLGISMCHIPYWVESEKVQEDKEKGIYEVVKVIQPFIKFDFVGRIISAEKSEILISSAQEIIFELAYKRGFYIHLITFDRFESVQTVQTLREKGFVAAHLSVDRTAYKIKIDYDKQDLVDRVSTDKQYNAAYECLRYAIQEERIEIPEHPDWEQETRGLEYLADKDKVIKSPHSSDDLVQSIAGAAFNASNNEIAEQKMPKELDDNLKDKTYQDPLYNQLYSYNNEVAPEYKHSNYSIGII